VFIAIGFRRNQRVIQCDLGNLCRRKRGIYAPISATSVNCGNSLAVGLRPSDCAKIRVEGR